MLNRLPLAEHHAFVRDALLEKDAAACWMRACGEPARVLRWEVQRSLGRHGRPDLVLSADGRPAIVVEVKVDAPWGSRSGLADDPGEDAVREQRELENQLHGYGEWLVTQPRPEGWPGALAALTRGTEPPDDFGGGGYGVPYTSARRWSAIHKWALDCEQDDSVADGASEMTQGLRREFAALLEEQNMSDDFMTRHDFATIEVALASILERRRRSASRTLTSGEGDRVARVAKVFRAAPDICKEPVKARMFLARPHPMLNGRTPLEVAIATGPGADMMVGLLGRAAYGGCV